jgi:hypothetical protein
LRGCWLLVAEAVIELILVGKGLSLAIRRLLLMLYWRWLGRLSKASALGEASMQILEMLDWSAASLARWLGGLLRLAVRTRSVV